MGAATTMQQKQESSHERCGSRSNPKGLHARKVDVASEAVGSERRIAEEPASADTEEQSCDATVINIDASEQGMKMIHSAATNE